MINAYVTQLFLIYTLFNNFFNDNYLSKRENEDL